MVQLPREEAEQKVGSLSNTMRECNEQLQKLMLNTDAWKSGDFDTLMALAERLVDTVNTLDREVEDFYHWLHGQAGTTPGLTRPGMLL
ncbi:MAG: hypothetical protein IJM64_09080 [Ottowia sp.]|nr:hypothetical protein [Ottowia sp.]